MRYHSGSSLSHRAEIFLGEKDDNQSHQCAERIGLGRFVGE